MDIEEKIENTIFLKQNAINILEKIKKSVEESETEKIRIKVETKHWYGFSEPFLAKKNHKITTNKYTMNLIIDECIKQERERINKLIDMEVEKRIKERAFVVEEEA